MLWTLFLIVVSGQVWDVYLPKKTLYYCNKFKKVRKFDHVEVFLNDSVVNYNLIHCDMVENDVLCGIGPNLQKYDIFTNTWSLVRNLNEFKEPAWFFDSIFNYRILNIKIVMLSNPFESYVFVFGYYNLLKCNMKTWDCNVVQTFYWNIGYVKSICIHDSIQGLWTIQWNPSILLDYVTFDLMCFINKDCNANFTKILNVPWHSECSDIHTWVDPRFQLNKCL